MKSGWIKKYTNKAPLLGADTDVYTGKVSWSKTQLDNMIGAALQHKGKIIEIAGVGNYWQSDTLQVEIGSTKKSFVSRRLKKQILSENKFLIIKETPNKFLCYFANSIKKDPNITVVPVDEKSIGKWFTLEMKAGNLAIAYFYTDKP